MEIGKGLLGELPKEVQKKYQEFRDSVNEALKNIVVEDKIDELNEDNAFLRAQICHLNREVDKLADENSRLKDLLRKREEYQKPEPLPEPLPEEFFKPTDDRNYRVFHTGIPNGKVVVEKDEFGITYSYIDTLFGKIKILGDIKKEIKDDISED